MTLPEPSRLAAGHLLLQGADGLHCRGSRCRHCGEQYFPPAAHCTACSGSELDPVDLGGQGTLWSWTIQSFLPKAPYNSGETEADFQPYGVGYVELPGGVRVEARLTVADPDRLRIGMPMRLQAVTYGRREDGTPLQTFAFAPLDAGDDA